MKKQRHCAIISMVPVRAAADLSVCVGGRNTLNQDSNAIVTLCSHICVGEGVRPLEPKEYSDLAKKLNRVKKTPKDLFAFTADDYKTALGFDADQIERITRLLDRAASLGFELARYQNMGIEIVTRADAQYPKRLKKKLSNACPPLFCYAGELSLLERDYVGYVGARSVAEEDMEFTKTVVRKTTSLGYGVVSGGARGIDIVSREEALLNGSFSVEYLSDSLLKKLKSGGVIRNIQQGRLLLMSAAKPDAGFHVGTAMMRNRYIYAQSSGTVVVRSDLNKGGTWAGACENLKHDWCPTLCWDHPYPGNQALIQKGAFPIGGHWDGKIPEREAETAVEEQFVQESLFDTGDTSKTER